MQCTCREDSGEMPYAVFLTRGFASRDIAPCCARTRRQVLIEDGALGCFSRQALCAEGSERVERSC